MSLYPARNHLRHKMQHQQVYRVEAITDCFRQLTAFSSIIQDDRYKCKETVPPLVEVTPGHFVACHRQNGEEHLVRGEVNSHGE